MPSRTLPGIGLNGAWAQGDPWTLGGNENWLRSSVLTQLAVESATTSLPASPLNGVIYIVPAVDTHGNQVAARDNGAWVYMPPAEGWTAYVRDTGVLMNYDGAAWVPATTPFAAALAATTGGGLIGLLSGRTAQQKSTDFITADDFSVPTDGTSDCSAAVQAMLNAYPGRTLTLLPRTYTFLSGLNIPADTEIWAWGATLDFSASHMTGLTFQNGGAIVGAKSIKGAGNTSYNAAGKAIICQGTNNAPAAPSYVNGPKILYCAIENWGATGVYLQYCNNPLVEFNSFAHIGYGAFQGLSCTGGHADRNNISDVSPGTAGNAYGISWTRNPGTLVADPVSLNCTGDGNIIDGIPLWEALDTHGGDGISFCGNTISNCKTPISLTFAPVASSTAIANKRCRAEGNVIYALNTGSAIRVIGATTGAVVDSYAEDASIRGNKITAGGIPNTLLGAVFMQATKNLNISGNIIDAPLVAGVMMTSDNQGFNISDNTITDPWDNTSASVSCILQNGNNNTGYIGNNVFAFRDAGLGTNVATYSIRFNPGFTGNDINVGRNSYVGITTGKLSFANVNLAGVNVSQAYSESGSAVIAVVSAGTSGFIDITFAKRFPIAPKITLNLAEPATNGGKMPIATYSNVTDTGFRILVRPYDSTTALLTTWTLSGNITVGWGAST